MSSIVLARHLDQLSVASRQQVVLRVVPLLATPLFVWLTVWLGSPFHPVLTTGLVLLALALLAGRVILNNTVFREFA